MLNKNYKDMTFGEQIEEDIRKYNSLTKVMHSLATKSGDDPSGLVRFESSLHDGFGFKPLSDDLERELESVLKMGEVQVRSDVYDIVAKERSRVCRRLVEKGIDYL